MSAVPNIPGLEQLPAKERSLVMAELNRLQLKDSMDTYNSLVERCFNECVREFRAKDLDSKEMACIGSCVRKFMEFSARLGQRFAEKNMASN
ncbi:tim10 ddp zinc finger domain-containing protein [Cyclospora cayetanensis]|uniref:Mitochondrial import inner membrane translocase subunit n=1 Tax=Cyclospora cayetanensis TaxID=88456 RepID=A0A1D3DAD4_9EIME|nr:tim10 ddp zinc finger domain-containing protein [Cyclospora cayetanensis]